MTRSKAKQLKKRFNLVVQAFMGSLELEGVNWSVTPHTVYDLIAEEELAEAFTQMIFERTTPQDMEELEDIDQVTQEELQKDPYSKEPASKRARDLIPEVPQEILQEVTQATSIGPKTHLGSPRLSSCTVSETYHISVVCRTPAHLCALYKESAKRKIKEVNLVEHSEGTTHVDASNFANDLDEAALVEN
ncbi:unnamed protein product [Arabidopsis thaliana]|uniref:(thale cress) hypothetical protein n=1 Tax=Arabidopsis thaliana TaxID=3702 RepID=A0A7G2ETN3_ARATH|nr:unnamed protein product [Arabidopsis thaliana]